MHYTKKSKIKLLFSLAVVLILVVIRINNPPSSIYKNETEFIGIVSNIKLGTCTSLEIKAKEKLLVYDCDNNEYEYGDKLKIKGDLQKPKNTMTFNYQNYLLSKNIHYIIYPEKITKIETKNNLFYKIKNKLNEKIESYQSQEYLKAFILGGTDLIDKDVLDSYQFNGISHLFAISGMHITLFSSFLFLILNRFFTKRKSIFLIILFLIFYIFITNFSPSVIRAVLMFTILNISFQKIKSLYVLIWLFLIMLLINPFYLYNLGFCFSYTVTFYLLYFNDLINKRKNNLTKTIAISIIAFLASIPIMIKNFNYINILSPIWNIILVPLVSLIIYPLALITYLFKPLDSILNYIMNYFEQISMLFEKIDLTIILKDISLLGIFLYFLLIFLTLKDKIFVLLLILVIILHTNINYFDKNAYLTIIDVGQGDSLLLKLPNNRGNILIDTGGNPYSKSSIAETRIIPYLKKEGIKKIDYLILTHGDFDHMGESVNLVNSFKVDKVIFNNDKYNELEQKLIEKLNEKNVKHYKGLKELNIDKYKLHFLNTEIYDNENDNSNVIYFKNNYQFLFMGDASKDREKDILDTYNIKNIDFLKVGHHGSATSTSEDFINSINPKYSLISVGKNNRYGHPKKTVLNILKDSKIYRTDKDGSIKIKFNENNYQIIHST